MKNQITGPLFPLSTKGVHGLCITMWMMTQQPATTEPPAHCSINRQRNL